MPNVVAALLALRPNKPRQPRRPGGGNSSGRRRGGGRGRGRDDILLAAGREEREEDEEDTEVDSLQGTEEEREEEDEAVDPAAPAPKKLHPEQIFCDSGEHAGDISFVHSFMALNMRIACLFHGCERMVQLHRVPDVRLVKAWLRSGLHVSQADHERSYYPIMQTQPPAAARGRGRGRGRGG